MKKTIVYLFVLVMLVTLVSSEKIIEPQINTEEDHLTIVFPKILTHPQNTNINLSFDVLNSNFTKLNDTSTDCSFISVNNIGTNISSGSLTYMSNQLLSYWYFPLDTTATSVMGNYNLYVYCNNTDIGQNGFLSSVYTITINGESSLKENYLLPLTIYFGIFAIVCILIGIFLYMGFREEG